jgi:hypothetical protein
MRAINVGVASHITAASLGGPRYDPSLSPEERSAVANGIWLCQTCAKLIDNDSTRYKRETLTEWKRLSEETAARALEVRRSSNNKDEDAFSKIERLMPELLAEMRTDISHFPLCREFVVLQKVWTFCYPDRTMFTYFYEDHDELDGKLRILENLGLIRDIRHNDVSRFAIEEKLADYLTA